MKIHGIKFKVSSAVSRTEIHEGRNHLVVPVIMMVEGVHSGSDGPKLYLKEEFSANYQAWNGMPVPIIHPTDDNGDPVSCNSPEIIERYNAGRIYNTTVDDQGRLRAEAWIDIQKAEKIHEGIISDLQSGNINMDVSTGLYSDDDDSSGVWQEENYEGVVRHIVPDHLALLPGQQGACSWEDGCGVRLNKKEQQKENKGGEGAMPKILTIEDAKKTGEDLITCLGDPAKKSWVTRRLASLASFFGNRLTDNGVSDREIRDQLQLKVDQLDTQGQPQSGTYHYIVAVYTEENYFVYEARGEGQGTKLFKQNFEIKDEVAVPKGSPSEVREQRQFVAAANKEANKQSSKQSSKQKTNEGGTPTMNKKKEKIDALISNEGSTFQETDREFLIGLDDSTFDTVSKINERTTASFQKTIADLEANQKTGTKGDKNLDTTNADDNTNGNAGNSAENSAENFIANAPVEIGEMLREGLIMRNRKKEDLIGVLTKNEACPFTKDQLAAKEITELEQLVNLAGMNSPVAPVLDYLGRGGNLSNQSFKRNERTEEGKGVPDMPSMITAMEGSVKE